jgi:hypothetical protein
VEFRISAMALNLKGEAVFQKEVGLRWQLVPLIALIKETINNAACW